MNTPIIYKNDVLAKLIHSNYRVLVTLDRMGIKLGMGNQTIENIAEQYNIETGAFLLILNLFCNKKYLPEVDAEFDYIPDILKYLKNSHLYFLEEKIPAIQQNIKELVGIIHNPKSALVEQFYNNYIEEVTEHIEYENETVFPYIEQLLEVYLGKATTSLLSTDYGIGIYGEHHEDIENVLNDLKNILIRHLPQEEQGKLRRTTLQQLFELESDLFSHTRIEDEVLIPLVKKLEEKLNLLKTDKG